MLPRLQQYRRFHQWLHERFGMHHFKLVPIRGGRAYKARCSCGLYIRRPVARTA